MTIRTFCKIAGEPPLALFKIKKSKWRVANRHSHFSKLKNQSGEWRTDNRVILK